VLRCLLEGLRWLWGTDTVKVGARAASGGEAWCVSLTPDLVRQEFWGLALAHFAVRGFMHEAALRADEDLDTPATLGAGRLSFLHAVRVVRRKLPLLAAFPLKTGSPCMTRCWTRFWRSAWQTFAAGKCRAGPSAR